MARAGGAPRGRALGAITKIIGSRTSATTITRPTTTTDSLDQKTETTTTHTEDLWITEPSKVQTEVSTGERLDADLMALGIDGIDVQQDDRIDHGGVTYEVDTVIGVPEDNDADGTAHSETEYFRAMLERYAA